MELISMVPAQAPVRLNHTQPHATLHLINLTNK